MRQRVDSTVIERLEEVANTPFKRISYTEAVDLLLKAIKEGKKFEFEVGAILPALSASYWRQPEQLRIIGQQAVAQPACYPAVAGSRCIRSPWCVCGEAWLCGDRPPIARVATRL